MTGSAGLFSFPSAPVPVPPRFSLLSGPFSVASAVYAAVARRRREIGVRTALGAQRKDVALLVLGEGMRLTSVGILAGVLGALWLTQWLSSLLFEITPSDPATFSAVALLLLVGGYGLVNLRKLKR